MGKPAKSFAYERIAEAIQARIDDGTLRPGDRLPSVRRTSVQWKVSIPTVLQAFRVLEARRIIQGKAKSGYFVLATGAVLPEPRPSRPSMKAAAVTTGNLIVDFLQAVADPSLIPLGSALPDPALLPTARLARTLGAVARRDDVRSAMISVPIGAQELRSEIARRSFATRAPVSVDDVVITAGCAEAITLSLRALTRPGETVIVESPAYFGTLQSIDALDLRALEISTDPREGIQLEALDEALSSGTVSAIVLTPTVHNPLGFVMSDERKRLLAEILDRHNVPVIEDETYAELDYSSERPASLRSFVSTAPVLSCGSFSKTLAPAYRVGWIIPGRYRDELLRLKAATSVATSLPTQLTIAQYLASGGYDLHLRKLKQSFRENLQRVSWEIAAHFPESTRVTDPAGGFLLWIELDERVDSLELNRRCLARGISLAPGPIFSTTGSNRNFIRINAGLPASEKVSEAIRFVGTEATRMAVD